MPASLYVYVALCVCVCVVCVGVCVYGYACVWASVRERVCSSVCVCVCACVCVRVLTFVCRYWHIMSRTGNSFIYIHNTHQCCVSTRAASGRSECCGGGSAGSTSGRTPPQCRGCPWLWSLLLLCLLLVCAHMSMVICNAFSLLPSFSLSLCPPVSRAVSLSLPLSSFLSCFLSLAPSFIVSFSLYLSIYLCIYVYP